MNQEIPKAPEVEKKGEYIPLNIAEDSQKKAAIIDKAVDAGKGTPDQAAIEKRAAEAKIALAAESQAAQDKAKNNQQTTLSKINLLS